MPDENETIVTETPPVETPPAATPPAQEEEHVPQWDFPTFEAPQETPPPPGLTQEEKDEYAEKIKTEARQSAVMDAFNIQAQAQKNLAALRTQLSKNGASDDVVQAAEEEFWSLGLGASDPRSVQFAAEKGFGRVALRGGQTFKPKPKVKSPDAAPVGNLRSSHSTEESAKAFAAFNSVAKQLGIELNEEDFNG